MPEIGRFKYGKLAKYPHMEREDVITWEKFIDLNPTAYDTCDYDFALGKVDEITDLAAAGGIAGAERVNKYRIDVIGYGNKETHLIEIKGRATPAILGHLRAEKLLYDRDEAAGEQTKMFVIAREATPEMSMLAKADKITLILV